MSQFLVSYDVDRPGQNYLGVIRRLESLRYKRVLLSQWVGNGDYTAAAPVNQSFQVTAGE